MSVSLKHLVAVACFCAICDAAMTESQEESCTDSTVKKQLVQTRANLQLQQNKAEEALTPEKCILLPVLEQDSKVPGRPKCVDGKFSSVCEGGHGGFAACPWDHPFMCTSRTPWGEIVCKKTSNQCLDLWWDPKALGGSVECEMSAATPSPPTSEPQPLQYVAATPTRQLDQCEGDCDRDKDCKGELKCFQRQHGEPVPGCLGTIAPTGGDTTSDFCYDPKGLGWPDVKYIGAKPKQLLDECEADCDNDKECNQGLMCFQRSDHLAIPGCSGEGTKDSDYCIKPVPKEGFDRKRGLR